MAYAFGYVLGQALAITIIFGVPIVIIAFILKKMFQKKGDS